MVKNADSIQWGIIGCGNVAEHKCGPALYRTPDSKLVAVMRRDRVKAQDFCARHGARRWYTEVEALLADPEINAVYIASPHYLHKTHATLAAQAGKSVLCEKPMGTSAAEAQAIVDVCKANGVPLTVAYYRRFWKVTHAIQQFLREGAIGRIVQVRVQLSDYFGGDSERDWLLSTEQSGGGALANAGSHWVHLIHYLLGAICDVMAFSSSKTSGFEIEDTIAAQLRTGDDVLISLTITLQSPVAVNEFEIAGTEGRIFASPLSEGRVYLWRRSGEPEVMPFPRTGVAHQELIEQVVKCLRNQEPSPLPGEQAVINWQIMEAIYRSCKEGLRVHVSR